jgi:hypothetical protein
MHGIGIRNARFVRRPAWRSGIYVIAAIPLIGCERASPSLDGDRVEPKAQYRAAVAAAEKLGVVARADDDGEVTYLDFYAVRDVPAAVVYIEKFPNLKLLNFSSTNLSDAEMQYLAGAKKLEELGLHETQITDAGLAHVAGLTNLKVLNLNNTQIGDEGLEHVSGLTQLEQLRLQSTKVTDAGLAHLAPLTELTVVWLSGSQVTPAGAGRLRQSLPEADIVHEEIVDRSGEPLLPASALEEQLQSSEPAR